MINNSIDLKNKRVLVTGASQGIGAGICHAMAACGADILVNYLQNRQAAEAVVSDLKDLYGIKVSRGLIISFSTILLLNFIPECDEGICSNRVGFLQEIIKTGITGID
jgi:NAD(P)-dependent dehydrogenase (short-subunit alcohol dehydrogenase family)